MHRSVFHPLPCELTTSKKGIFNNVMVGDQRHDSEACETKKVYVASPGWDHVTGLRRWTTTRCSPTLTSYNAANITTECLANYESQ